ncbi:MAG: heat-inducible transcriptional repressor HrcA [Coriobacteriia bacterium]|nr:heat-inducible transcriptional repressor HrcA [Coriobacteriia bacterium]
MTAELNPRRRTVLTALVEEYIRSVQPVGSKVLVDRYSLGCSPATVRSELVALEETGYVYQPHVSAGRIPTDSGYRAFVDDVAEGSALSAEEVGAVHSRYDRLERELSEVMRETSAVLSALTSYVAIVAAPTLRRARICRISVVPLAAQRALVVVVTDSGQVANRSVDFDYDTDARALADVEAYLNGILDSLVGDDALRLRDGVAEQSDVHARAIVRILDEVIDCMVEADQARVLTGGVSALLAQPEFSDPGVVRPLLGLLEDGLLMLRVLADVMSTQEVLVRIGHENGVGALERVSFVAGRYGDGDTGGIVGVIGPTRMDYPRAVASVRTVADTLSEILG